MAKTLPKNADVADQFDLLADFLELEGSDQFRPLAYRRAAQRMRETGGSIAQLAVEGRAKELSGIGKTIEEKIVQIVETGPDRGPGNARSSGSRRASSSSCAFPGSAPRRPGGSGRSSGISTVEELKQAAEAEQLRTLTGLGPKTEENVLRALARPKKEIERVPLLGQALPAVRAVVSVLREHPAADQVSEAGSVRRLKERVRDLDIIATASDPAALTEYLTKLKWVEEVAAHGKTKAVVVSNEGLRFDLRVVPPDSYGNLLQHFTGSKQHNVALREDAVRRKLSVSEYGVQNTETGEMFTDRSEETLYERLGYAWIPPELRENMGELEAAREGRLPQLVELSDVRGDMHSHSTWSSDGRNTIEEMALEAKRLGRSYLAVTDHSHYLREGRLEAQNRELDAVQERLGRFKLVRGIEVNIRANGELDVDDDTLAQRDWVMASVHSGFDKDLTGRVLAAMENPHVDCIGHLTGRKLNRRPPADHRPGESRRKGPGNGHVPGDQRPARPPRHARRARAAGRRGRSQDRHLQRRASDQRALEPRVRRRPGPARVAGPGSDPEHAALGRGQEAPQAPLRYRAVIFDLWQTLIPWPTESAQALYVEMADSVGAPREQFEEVWLSGRSARDTGPITDSVRWVFGQLGLDDADPQTIVSLRREWTRESIVPRPDAVSTLEELRRRGHELGLITVCSTDVAELWEATPFRGLFDATVFSCEVGISKPDPRIYELCCEQLGVQAGDCLFVGDGANYELPGAEKVGMTALQLRAPGEDLTEPGKEWRAAPSSGWQRS